MVRDVLLAASTNGEGGESWDVKNAVRENLSIPAHLTLACRIMCIGGGAG